MIETHPFSPFLPANLRYLLLGSFTAKSANTNAEYDWYYGSKASQFWKILELVYTRELKTTPQKQQLFSQLGMGVADIILKCERSQGNSSDLNLVNIVYNVEAIQPALESNSIEKIYFSSRFVEKKFKKVFAKAILGRNFELITLPSPSPRYAVLSKDQKVARYKKLLPTLK